MRVFPGPTSPPVDDRPSALSAQTGEGRAAPFIDHLHRRLLDAGAAGGGPEPTAISDRARDLVDREAAVLHAQTRTALTLALVRRATGLGPLEVLLADDEVDEVMVCGCAPIWIERRGRLARTTARFSDEAELREIVDRILAPLGRRVDATQPMCDARLPDGSRVNVTIPPLAIDGTTITIRRFRAGGRSIDELVACGSWTAEAADLLRAAVAARRTILICGATGSGKTTVLGALSEAIAPDERIITIEDAAELRLRQPHVVRLEARTANLEGAGQVTVRDLVINAMRMRPDRLIVGEVRGGEALDLLLALSSGHAGGLSTIHAGSPAEALRRLELLATLAEGDLPLAAVTALVRGSVELVVHQERDPSGVRRLLEIAEVGADGELQTRYSAARPPSAGRAAAARKVAA